MSALWLLPIVDVKHLLAIWQKCPDDVQLDSHSVLLLDGNCEFIQSTYLLQQPLWHHIRRIVPLQIPLSNLMVCDMSAIPQIMVFLCMRLLEPHMIDTL